MERGVHGVESGYSSWLSSSTKFFIYSSIHLLPGRWELPGYRQLLSLICSELLLCGSPLTRPKNKDCSVDPRVCLQPSTYKRTDWRPYASPSSLIPSSPSDFIVVLFPMYLVLGSIYVEAQERCKRITLLASLLTLPKPTPQWSKTRILRWIIVVQSSCNH